MASASASLGILDNFPGENKTTIVTNKQPGRSASSVLFDGFNLFALLVKGSPNSWVKLDRGG